MKTTFKKTLLIKSVVFSLLLLMSMTLPACFLFDNDDPEPEPKKEVPAELARKWMAGKFAMREFWGYNGSYNGNAFETGIAFDFKPDGTCEFYLIAAGTTYSCRTEAFVYKKGTVEFHADESFTFRPTEGRARGFYKGCAAAYQNYDKETDKKDLQPEKYFYTLQQDSKGEDQLVIRFQKDATSSTTFYPVNW